MVKDIQVNPIFPSRAASNPRSKQTQLSLKWIWVIAYHYSRFLLLPVKTNYWLCMCPMYPRKCLLGTFFSKILSCSKWILEKRVKLPCQICISFEQKKGESHSQLQRFITVSDSKCWIVWIEAWATMSSTMWYNSILKPVKKVLVSIGKFHLYRFVSLPPTV